MKDRNSNSLSLVDATSLIIGVIIGAGIYETAPSIAAAAGSEFGVFVLWLLGAFLSICGALVYAELAALFPRNGGDMVYLKTAFGPVVGYLFAWSRLVVVQPGSIAAMAFIFARYSRQLLLDLGVFAPPSLVHTAGLVVILITTINVRSVRKAVYAQNALTFLKMLSLALIAASFFCSADAVTSEASFKPAPWSLGLILVLFCYGGWNQISFVTEEVHNPEKNILLSMVYGILITGFLYVCINAAFIGVLGYEGLATSTAVARDTLAQSFPNIAHQAISFMICVSSLGAIQGMIFTGGKLNAAFGMENPVFSFIGVPAHRPPTVALIVQGLVSLAIIWFTHSFSSTVVYTSGIVWFFFSLTAFGFFILRAKESRRYRPFTMPMPWLFGSLFLLSCIYLMYSSVAYDERGALISFIIVLAGIPIRWLLLQLPANKR